MDTSHPSPNMPPPALPPRVNQLAYRIWRDIPKPALSDVRLRFLNRLRDVVEAATELVGTALFALLGGVAGAAGNIVQQPPPC